MINSINKNDNNNNQPLSSMPLRNGPESQDGNLNNSGGDPKLKLKVTSVTNNQESIKQKGRKTLPNLMEKIKKSSGGLRESTDNNKKEKAVKADSQNTIANKMYQSPSQNTPKSVRGNVENAFIPENLHKAVVSAVTSILSREFSLKNFESEVQRILESFKQSLVITESVSGDLQDMGLEFTYQRIEYRIVEQDTKFKTIDLTLSYHDIMAVIKDHNSVVIQTSWNSLEIPLQVEHHPFEMVNLLPSPEIQLPEIDKRKPVNGYDVDNVFLIQSAIDKYIYSELRERFSNWGVKVYEKLKDKLLGFKVNRDIEGTIQFTGGGAIQSVLIQSEGGLNVVNFEHHKRSPNQYLVDLEFRDGLKIMGSYQTKTLFEPIELSQQAWQFQFTVIVSAIRDVITHVSVVRPKPDINDHDQQIVVAAIHPKLEEMLNTFLVKESEYYWRESLLNLLKSCSYGDEGRFMYVEDIPLRVINVNPKQYSFGIAFRSVAQGQEVIFLTDKLQITNRPTVLLHVTLAFDGRRFTTLTEIAQRTSVKSVPIYKLEEDVQQLNSKILETAINDFLDIIGQFIKISL